jgi:prepilin-type N-terminal cleavage/methylation domain-containing protein
MKKKGFTLIELMIVVMIMGTLAAIAVPKLFGMIVKAKVSEVAFSAGAYIKLQETYIHEFSKGGTWQAIGYKSPAGNSSGKASSATFEYDATQSAYNWSAEAIVKLNDCAKGKKWFVNFSLNISTHLVHFWASSDDITKCSEPLTPNFKYLSTVTAAITTPGSVN